MIISAAMVIINEALKFMERKVNVDAPSDHEEGVGCERSWHEEGKVLLWS